MNGLDSSYHSKESFLSKIFYIEFDKIGGSKASWLKRDAYLVQVKDSKFQLVKINKIAYFFMKFFQCFFPEIDKKHVIKALGESDENQKISDLLSHLKSNLSKNSVGKTKSEENLSEESNRPRKENNELQEKV